MYVVGDRFKMGLYHNEKKKKKALIEYPRRCLEQAGTRLG